MDIVGDGYAFGCLAISSIHCASSMRIQKTMAFLMTISLMMHFVPGGLGGPPPSPWEDDRVGDSLQLAGTPAGSGPSFTTSHGFGEIPETPRTTIIELG